MRFDIKLFKTFFVFSIVIVITISLILSFVFYRSYIRLKRNNLYFINTFLFFQSENMNRGLGRMAGEIEDSGAFKYILDKNDITRTLARKDLYNKFLTILKHNRYIYEIRIQKGKDIVVTSSKRPFPIQKTDIFLLKNSTFYHIHKFKTDMEGVTIILIVDVGSVLSNFNNYFIKYYNDIAYLFGKRYAILFDKDGAKKILPVRVGKGYVLIKKEKYLLLDNGPPSPVKAVISFSDFYKGILFLVTVILFFISISTIVVFIASKKLSYSLTFPIRRLSSVLSNVRKGRFERYENKEEIEEIKALVDSYNIMIDRIRNFTYELEKEVKRRTYIIENQKRELEKLNIELREAAITDSLTGVYNRRYLEEKLRERFEIAKRSNLYMGVAVIDVDQFKDINDTYGHLCGDYILKEIANIIKSVFKRKSDAIFRYGGDEFIVSTIHSEYRRTELFSLLEKLRAQVESASFSCGEMDAKIRVTISIGLYFDNVYDKEDVGEILKIADKMMYEVKKLGKNRVIVN